MGSSGHRACELIVVKIGGAAVDDQEAAFNLMEQVARCLDSGKALVLVHGGGDRLTRLAMRLGVEAPFVNGRRVTNDGLIEAAKMAFAGGVGTDLAAAAHRAGVKAVALSGVAAGLIGVTKRPVKDDIDYGWVGDVHVVRADVVTTLLTAGYTPLIASLGVDRDGRVFNVNADTVACTLAIELQADRLIMLTGPDGVMRDLDDPNSRVPMLQASAIRDKQLDFAVSGGMLPKLANIADAVLAGVGAVHLASWRRPDVLNECLHGSAADIGTRIC